MLVHRHNPGTNTGTNTCTYSITHHSLKHHSITLSLYFITHQSSFERSSLPQCVSGTLWLSLRTNSSTTAALYTLIRLSSPRLTVRERASSLQVLLTVNPHEYQFQSQYKRLTSSLEARLVRCCVVLCCSDLF